MQQLQTVEAERDRLLRECALLKRLNHRESSDFGQHTVFDMDVTVEQPHEQRQKKREQVGMHLLWLRVMLPAHAAVLFLHTAVCIMLSIVSLSFSLWRPHILHGCWLCLLASLTLSPNIYLCLLTCISAGLQSMPAWW